MRIFFAVVIVLVAVSGCSSGVDKEPLAFVVADLPDDFPEQPLFWCLGGVDSTSGSIIGYRGTVAIESEEYRETAFVRMGSLPDEHWSVSGVVGEFDSASEPVQVSIDGSDGVLFSVATAEPLLTPWPALAWRSDGAVHWLLGEGLGEEQVFAAAVSVRPATPHEISQGGFLGSEECE